MFGISADGKVYMVSDATEALQVLRGAAPGASYESHHEAAFQHGIREIAKFLKGHGGFPYGGFFRFVEARGPGP